MPTRRNIKREVNNQARTTRASANNNNNQNNFTNYNQTNQGRYIDTSQQDPTTIQYTYQDQGGVNSNNRELVAYQNINQGPNNLNLYQTTEDQSQNILNANNPNMANPNQIYPVTSTGTILTSNDGTDNYVYVQQQQDNAQITGNNQADNSGQPRELGYVQFNSRNASSNFNQIHGTLAGQDHQNAFVAISGIGDNTRTRLGGSNSSNSGNGYVNANNAVAAGLTMENKEKMTNIYNQLQQNQQHQGSTKNNLTRFVNTQDPYELQSTYLSSGRLSEGMSTREHHDSQGDLNLTEDGDQLDLSGGNSMNVNSNGRGKGDKSKKSEGKREIQNFIQKLASMLEKAADGQNYPNYQTSDGKEPLIAWNGPDSFIIREPNKFTKDMVPAFFKSNKRESFIRQLNTYGFRKITNIENDNLMAENQHWEEVLHYTHPNFTRDNRENWVNIRRRRADKREAPDDLANSPGLANIGLDGTNMPNLGNLGANSVTNDRITLIMQEMRKLNEHNQTVTEQMIKLSKDNEMLKQQNVQLFEREKRNKTNIANVVTLLSKLMKRKKYNNGTSNEYPELMATASYNSADEPNNNELRSATMAITAGPSNHHLQDEINARSVMSSGIGISGDGTMEKSAKSRRHTITAAEKRDKYNSDKSIAINESKSSGTSKRDDSVEDQHYFKLEKVAKSPTVEMPSASPPSIKEIVPQDELSLGV